MSDSGRRFCRLCGKAAHIDDLIAVAPMWSIPTKQHERRMCSRCIDLCGRISKRLASERQTIRIARDCGMEAMPR